MTAQPPSAITYKQVRKLVEKGFPGESRLVEAVAGLVGATMVVTSLTFGPLGAAVLGWFDAKGEAAALTRSAASRIAAMRGGDFLERSRRLATAEFLITYTAFFDALHRVLPGPMAKVELTLKERRTLVARRERGAALDDDDPAMTMPHPVAGPDERKRARRNLYTDLVADVRNFISGLAIDIAVTGLDEEFDRVPAVACMLYEAQLFDLAAAYPQFYAWTSLQELENAQRLTEALAAQVGVIAELSTGIDLGMQRLASTLSSSGVAAPGRTPHAVAAALHRYYSAEIDRRIIEDRYAGANDREIRYPRRSDIFVPQAFKTTRYTGPQNQLEDEGLWDALPAQNDLGPFLIRYLESAYSAETPLLVLGHPGSGKSLLSLMLAARLAPPQFNPVRLELHDISPDTSLQTQLEEQIRRDTGYTVSWPEFAEALDDSPPLVILDGYDELLQASGRVFADYLTEVQRFQQREILHGRPIRIVLTSRIALINKAAVPGGTTVLRLLELDETRRRTWMSVWNRHNRPYFVGTGTREFELPESEGVLDLARQPLLLLMLALYDSRGNELHRDASLDQTLLYNGLLARFVRRELEKGKGAAEFAALGAAERDARIEEDLARLGVAAIGMFNRQSVHISSADLDADVAYFALGRDVPVGTGWRLSQADLLFGSFFFIHESRTGTDAGRTSFEFLHNTFGEFLAADFLLRQLLDETEQITDLSANDRLAALLAERLRQPSDRLLACLIHTPLHSRPLVFQLLRQWLPHRLAMRGRTLDEILTAYDRLLNGQIRDLLFGTDAPAVARPTAAPYAPLPIMGHQAVLTLNLVVLRTAIAPEEFVFDEEAIDPDSRVRPWDRLTHLWRSWFSVEELTGIATTLTAERRASTVLLRPNDQVLGPPLGSQLEAVLVAAETLADDLTTGLAGLVFEQTRGMSKEALARTAAVLASEDIEVSGLITSITARRQPRILENRGSPLRRLDHMAPVSPGQLINALAIANLTMRDTILGQSYPMKATDPTQLYELSRFEATLLINFKAFHGSRWLYSVLLDLANNPEQVRRLLRSEAAPALFWASAEYVTDVHPMLADELASIIAEPDVSPDAETTVALLAFARAGSSLPLATVAMTALTTALTDDPRCLLTLSYAAADQLYQVNLPPPLRDALATAVDLLLPKDVQLDSDPDRSAVVKLCVACGVSSLYQVDFIRQRVDELPDTETDQSRTSELLWPLIRAVRMIDAQELTQRLIEGPVGFRGDEWPVPDPHIFGTRVADLSVRQLDDLVWLSEKQDDQDSLDAVRDALQRHGLDYSAESARVERM